VPEANHVTDELTSLQEEVRRYRRDSELLQVVLASRSWRWTKPLRLVFHVLRHGGLSAEDRQRLDALPPHSGHLPEDTEDNADIPALPLVEPPHVAIGPADELPAGPDLLHLHGDPAPQGDKPDIYVWSVIDWHFRVQRPQHLARALSEAGHRVFYMSNNFVDCDEPGFKLERLDDDGRLLQVHLHLLGAPAIYTHSPTPEQSAQLAGGLAAFAEWHDGGQAVSIVQHPYWTLLAGRPPTACVVYDCMDHHAGFANNTSGILTEERHLIASSDLVIVTSHWLEQEIGRQDRPVALIRNATEFEHFNRAPTHVFSDPDGQRVIGYYGAIAHWFDVDLVRTVAEAFPQHLVLLIGSDTTGAAQALSDLANVQCTGEVKYSELPYWLHGFDVCLLPFKVEPLTLATNPVKIYEYLSAGKPVVAVDLPEMAQFGKRVRVAGTPLAFVEEVADALAATDDAAARIEREAFASSQTWAVRASELDTALALVRPARVTVIVVTYNNLYYTRNCLDSLERYSDWSELEIIVVDNASQDETPAYLREWATRGKLRHVILNVDNRGFAAANNQGLAAASGDYMVLLNNDTYVTRDWVRGLLAHLRRDPDVGLVGPVTNNIGNEARVDANYADMEAMARFATNYTARHAGRAFELPTLAFFCVAMSRATYERIGPLDEDFGIGFFEDDDYCRRVALEGLRCVCAEDVFIHHHLSASFEKLKDDQRQQLFERNKGIYEKKWGPWTPHTYRAPGEGNPAPPAAETTGPTLF